MGLFSARDILSGKVKEPGGLTIEEFQNKVRSEKGQSIKICGHEGCKNPLGPRVDGEHNKIGGVPVCEDCYYGTMGEELENFPIGRLGIKRR